MQTALCNAMKNRWKSVGTMKFSKAPIRVIKPSGNPDECICGKAKDLKGKKPLNLIACPCCDERRVFDELAYLADLHDTRTL